MGKGSGGCENRPALATEDISQWEPVQLPLFRSEWVAVTTQCWQEIQLHRHVDQAALLNTLWEGLYAAYEEELPGGALTQEQRHRTLQDHLAYEALDGEYRPNLALLHSLAKPTTTGAKNIPCYSLDELQSIVTAHPHSLVAISDVHGQIDELRYTLRSLGVIDDTDNRIGNARLLQIGDLADGRHEIGDVACLQAGREWFDVMLAGNHEAALLGGTEFGGQPTAAEIPATTNVLRSFLWEGRLQAAWVENDVLYTHAGVSDAWGWQDDPTEAMKHINAHWEHFLGRNSDLAPSLFAVDQYRSGGGSAKPGGVLWQDWRNSLQSSATYRQVVGHTPRPRLEARTDDRLIDIDVEGPRIGVSVQTPEGSVYCGSSIVVV